MTLKVNDYKDNHYLHFIISKDLLNSFLEIYIPLKKCYYYDRGVGL